MSRDAATLLTLLVVLLTATAASAGEPVAEMASVEAFVAAAEAGRDDPKEIARLAVLGLVVYARDEPLALQMFTALVEPDEVEKDERSPTGLKVIRAVSDDLARTRGRPEIAAGYCGGTPGEAYADADLVGCPVRFDEVYSASRQGVGYPHEGRAKFFVANGGASLPRPLVLIQHESIGWRLRTWGSLLTGVAAPAER